MDMDVSHEADHDRATKNITRKELFLACIGFHEFFSAEMWRAAFTELVATACLIFTLTTCIISCLDSHEADPKLLVPFAIFIVAFLFLMVTVPLSGGHMSPVFTFIAALKGIITLARAAMCVLAQCLGSIIRFVTLIRVMNNDAAQKYNFGGCTIGGEKAGISAESALVLEFTCTFLGLYVGVTVAFDNRRSKELGLAMVCAVVAGAMALAVFVSITITGHAGYSGVGLSPARCLGPALLHGGPLWEGHWVFCVGPFVACTVYYGFQGSKSHFNVSVPPIKPSLGKQLQWARACYLGTGVSANFQGRNKYINAQT